MGFVRAVPASTGMLLKWIFNPTTLSTCTSARAKSYQRVKVVSGGRECGKSLILDNFGISTTFIILMISLFWGRAPGKV